MFGLGLAQFLPFVITIAGIVFTDLLRGIGIGMVAALFAILRSHYLNSHFLHMKERDQEGQPHEVRIELAEEVTFLNKGAILRALKQIPDHSHVVIDQSASVFIDQDVREIIADFQESAPGRSIEVEIVKRLEDAMRAPRFRSAPAEAGS